jgi:DNA-binding beta-propeller fold protein YncE
VKKLLILPALFLLALPATGQGAVRMRGAALSAEASALSTAELWSTSYNGPADSYDRGVDVTVSPDGETVFVIGQSFGPPRDSYYATIAYSASTGVQLWARRYTAGGIGHDYPADVAVSPDAMKVFVTGGSSAETRDPSGRDYATIAYEASTGDRLWARRYNGPGNDDDNASALTVSSDGSTLFVTGSSSTESADADYQTLAYDTSTGAKLWGRRYDGPVGDCDNDSPHAIAATPDGSRVFVTGQSCAVAGGGSGDATLAYDAATGNRLWLKRFEFDDYLPGVGDAIAVSPDGKTVFVTGASAGDSTDWDYATVAYDAATGAKAWEKRYNGPPGDDQDRANALAMSPDGSMVFVTGESRMAGNYDYATVAYDALTGRRQWVERYDGPENGDDFAWSIAVSSDGSSVFITGGSGHFSAQGDYATLAYDAGTGAKRWVERYNGPSNEWDYARSIAVSPDGTKVFVTGTSLNTAGYDDFATVAYRA